MTAMESRRVALVTGATGFIGSRLVAQLQATGWHVIATTRKAAGDSRVVLDLGNECPLELPRGIDTIFHLAGKAHALAELAQDEEEYFRINTEGTRRMLEAARRAGVRAFVLFSSVKAFGCDDTMSGPIDETCKTAPTTPYGKSKLAAEQLVLRSGEIPHPVVLRLSLVYGPAAKGNLEKMITAVRRNRFPPLPEFGNRRSMVHVDDVVEAALLVAQHPSAAGQIFVVSDDAPFSTRQLFEWVCVACGRRVPSWSVPYWVLRILGWVGGTIGYMRRRRFVFDGDALAKLSTSAWYSSVKLQRELGWHPQHTLQATISQVIGLPPRDGK